MKRSAIQKIRSLISQRLAAEAIMLNLLWGVATVLVVLWVLGFTFHVAGGLIHLLLVLAVVSVLLRVIMGRKVLV
jgi:Family of unknown function (DUF5670)